MITGVGTDIVRIERIRKLRAAAVSRLLTPAEEKYCRAHLDPAPRIAGRFAAKEAILKAMGTGLSAGASWKQIEILPDHAGAPKANFSGAVARKLRALGAKRCHISISHEEDHAVAFVVFESES
ncbi:MAG TPA: holo-ACP synthase [Fibrobacteria bacterium]|jgi:holo-[acyl-carrier protein] synthase|nr:holo-ACP synthase [Fibrobacteria bacterium]